MFFAVPPTPTATASTIPVVTQASGDPVDIDLWGMPLELAVGLIGVGGAVLGAVLAAGATIWVAQWQAREQLRQSRLMVVGEAVAELQAYCVQRLMEVEGAGHSPESDAALPQEGRKEFITLAVRAMTQAAPVAPDLSAFLRANSGGPEKWRVYAVTAMLWKLNTWVSRPDESEEKKATMEELLLVVAEAKEGKETRPFDEYRAELRERSTQGREVRAEG